MLDSDNETSSELASDEPIDFIHDDKKYIENLVFQNKVKRIYKKI